MTCSDFTFCINVRFSSLFPCQASEVPPSRTTAGRSFSQHTKGVFFLLWVVVNIVNIKYRVVIRKWTTFANVVSLWPSSRLQLISDTSSTNHQVGSRICWTSVADLLHIHQPTGYPGTRSSGEAGLVEGGASVRLLLQVSLTYFLISMWSKLHVL